MWALCLETGAMNKQNRSLCKLKLSEQARKVALDPLLGSEGEDQGVFPPVTLPRWPYSALTALCHLLAHNH